MDRMSHEIRNEAGYLVFKGEFISDMDAYYKEMMNDIYFVSSNLDKLMTKHDIEEFKSVSSQLQEHFYKTIMDRYSKGCLIDKLNGFVGQIKAYNEDPKAYEDLFKTLEAAGLR